MNKKIKEILEKHLASAMIHSPAIRERINSAIIEICEEQKKTRCEISRGNFYKC